MIEKEYWRSLNELAETEEFQSFMHREFPDAAQEPPGSLERRRFLQLMGASLSLAGLSACRWPEEKILPFSRRPDDFVPGEAKAYASAMELGGEALGLAITARDGRPVKIEGNAKHPFTRGGTSAYAQASILELYDPDRSQKILRSHGDAAQAVGRDQLDVFLAKLAEDNVATGGDGLRILSGQVGSPTLARLKDGVLAKYPRARWFEYESLSTDAIREGTRSLFGRPVRPRYDLNAADVVLALDADILGTEPGALAMMRAWGERRRPETNEVMLRLYAAESRLSNTGAQADHRLPLKFQDVGGFLLALSAEILQQLGTRASWAAPTSTSWASPKAAKWVKAVAADLVAHRGRALIIPGYRQPAQVHAIAHFVNTMLDATDKVVHYLETPDPARPTHFDALNDLAKDIESGQAKTLVMIESNPVYQAPGDLGFAKLIEKVPTSIHLGLYVDETAEKSGWHIPAAHFLERWGDARSWDGTVSIVQPLIKPLYNGLSAIELCLALLQQPQDAEREVRATFSLGYGAASPATAGALEDPHDDKHPVGRPASVERVAKERGGAATDTKATASVASAPLGAAGGAAGAAAAASAAAGVASPVSTEESGASPAVSPAVASVLPGYQPISVFDRRWRIALRDGFVDGSAFNRAVVTAASPSVDLAAFKEAEKASIEITFFDDQKLYDGRFANNAWLQETPEFITKLTWDNALLLSPTTAAQYGVTDEDLVKISGSGVDVSLPVLVVPGQPEGSAAIALGYGRRSAGIVGGHEKAGVGVAGFDTTSMRRSATPYASHGLNLAKLGRKYPLASTQDHFAIDDLGREEIEKRAPRLIREATQEEYAKNPGAIREMEHGPALLSLFQERESDGHRWGLAVDLSACVGCNACVVACQSENNVPVVGKDQVRRGREMHWMRIDRYFKGPADEPEVAVQPVACMQCENAPCEQVCPVAATMHSAEGLNDMVYNRCIGTRYCSNNCPYKVRRFNFFNYHLDLKEPENRVKTMVFNPEVTVRARGVMEKCTYCVQRIQAAKHTSRLDGRPIADGDITPACASACPSQAIVFGDLADPNSRVSKAHAVARAYAMLAELNVKPRTQYLARIRNPNPALKGA
ncbi:MAG: TAT-variant-translocated molybdopterin oxidoreductase [Deltaproteobacteria bacterium]|nr:TAT-variant-translocated molybdopterin oxidoreductase [Deltaproteobacteria bacterium]